MVAVYEYDHESGSYYIESVSLGFLKMRSWTLIRTKAACLFVCFSERENNNEFEHCGLFLFYQLLRCRLHFLSFPMTRVWLVKILKVIKSEIDFLEFVLLQIFVKFRITVIFAGTYWVSFVTWVYIIFVRGTILEYILFVWVNLHI